MSSCFEIEDISISFDNGKPMDHPHLRLMVLRDNILTFKQLEGETFHEFWPIFEALLQQCLTHGILDEMLLDCFYIGLSPENRILANQYSSGCLIWQPYETVAQLLIA